MFNQAKKLLKQLTITYICRTGQVLPSLWQNQADKNAIAVYVMMEDDYEKVGYIPKELTMYLHGPLKASELDFSMKDVQFCTRNLLMGFYITLSIAKKGAWNSFAVRASLKVD